jgi:sialate O-acetylesterase
MKRITCYLLMLLYAAAVFGNDRGVEIPDVFSDNMILQREAVVPVWGRAEDGTKVSVTFAGLTKKTKAKDGVWRVEFPPMEANKTPQTMRVSASDGFKKEIRNVLIGDVWLASGQSNMEMNLAGVKEGEEAIAASENPMLRLFKVPRSLENEDWPVGTSWQEANPQSTPPQSAVGYFFVQELQEELDIPIGLLNCSYGGTVTETWCSPEVLKASYPEWEAWEKARLQDPEHSKRNTSSFLYNRMVKSVLPFQVKGFIWYQGEGNAGRPEEQKELFPAMVNDWRKSWGNKELPFYFVQLARYDRANWHRFRDAQREIADNLPHSYLAVTIDLSKDWSIDNHPIHPNTKKPIGHRLALAALANVYGKDMVYSGPVVKEMEVESGRAILSFNHMGSGLRTLDGKRLRGFYISEDGENFVEAEAKIAGKTITVSDERVRAPVAVRYGAEDDMGKEDLSVNLSNAEGLPASPFTIRLGYKLE